MTPRHRRAFFLGALLLFTIIAPVLILGASGYRYNFQEQALVPTGTLVLKSYPEGATVLINQKEETRTPAEIQGLLPSRYILEVNRDDFRPWRKEVEIQANRITVEDQILLIPKRIAVSSVLEKEIRTFAVSPDGRKLIYVRQNKPDVESLWFLDLESGEEHLLFPFASDQKILFSVNDSIDRLLWLVNGRGVAFSISTPESKRYFILAVGEDDQPEGAFEWRPPGRGEVDHWKWTESGLSLFFMQEEFLYRADYEKRSVEQVTPDRVRGYALQDNSIYFVTASPPVLFRQDLLTGDRDELAALPIEPIEEDRQLPPDPLVLSAQGKIALIDRQDFLWIIDDVPSATPLPVAAGVQTALFNADGQRLLYQTKQGLFVYHLEEGETLGGREAGSFETIIQRKGKVLGPIWYSDQFHILYGAGDTLYITEVGGQGPPNTYPLFRIPGEAPKFVYHDPDQVTFLFRNRLYQADLSFGRPRSILLGSRL